MNVIMRRAVSLAVTIGFGVVFSAFGQSTVEFGITSPGDPGNVLSGVYTDPYQGYVEAVGGTPGQGGTAIAAFCDDFTDDVTPPQYWNAFDTNLSALSDSNSGPVSSVYYGDYSPTILTAAQQTTDYIAVAILAVDSMENAGNATVQDQLSFALWNVFDNNVLTSDCNAYGCLDPSDCNPQQGCSNPSEATNFNTAVIDYNNAMKQAASYTSGAAYLSAIDAQFGENVSIQIYTPETGGVVDQSGSRPQEFVTVQTSPGNGQPLPTPEASTWAAIGIDFIGVGVLGLVFRRRQLRNRS